MTGRDMVTSHGSNVIAQVVVIVGLWLALACVAMFEFGLWPRTSLGWVLILSLGPGSYFAAACVGELIVMGIQRVPWVQRSRSWVERRTSEERFSWLRIGYALAGALCLLLVFIGLWLYAESGPKRNPGVVKQFIVRHFR